MALMGYCPGRQWLARFHRVIVSNPDVHPAAATMLSKAYGILQFAPPRDGDSGAPWADVLWDNMHRQDAGGHVHGHGHGHDAVLGTSPLSPALGQASGEHDVHHEPAQLPRVGELQSGIMRPSRVVHL